MDYEDRMTIATPEGVSVQVRLAGLGSRAGAALLDGLIQGAVIFVLALIIGEIAEGDPTDVSTGGSDAELALFTLAILNILMFVVLFFYFVFFETLWGGQTVGKRAFRLRVVQLSGARIGFKASMIRNLVRIVDLLPAMYIIGIVSVLLNERNQRLGDIVAGTIVVSEGPVATEAWSAPSVPVRTAETAPEATRTWDVSAITNEELVAVRAFLGRRYTIPSGVRAKLAEDLDAKLRPKVAGAQDWDGVPESFLELLAAVKSARS